VKWVPDNDVFEKEQAELLSTAIDALNRGEMQAESQENGLQELLLIAKLVKDVALPPASPPQAVLANIVNQTANTIVQKKKRRFARGFTGLLGAAAAILLFVFSQTMPPVSPRQELAKMPQPAPNAEPQSPAIDKSPADVAKDEILASDAVQQATSHESEPIRQPPAVVQSPAIESAPPLPPVPAASGDTMLVLAERKADMVTIDSVSKVIRQVYNQGAPDEIIVTQAPKRPDALRTAPSPSKPRAKRTMTFANESGLTPPDRNRVTVNVGNSEVTIEGAATEEELLKLVQTLTEVSVAEQSTTSRVP